MSERVIVELIFNGTVVETMVMNHAYPIIETPMSPSMEILPCEGFPDHIEMISVVWRYIDARLCECGHGYIHRYEFVGVNE